MAKGEGETWRGRAAAPAQTFSAMSRIGGFAFGGTHTPRRAGRRREVEGRGRGRQGRACLAPAALSHIPVPWETPAAHRESRDNVATSL